MAGLDAARTAVAAGAWAQALAALAALPDPDVLDFDATEIRATAMYALGDLEGCLAAWEHLHTRCAATGDRLGAARAAAMTALFLLVDTGLLAPVRGWIARAERALADTPTGPVHATIAMIRTYERFLSGDLPACRNCAATAVRLGERHDVVAAVVIGRVAQARLLLLEHRVDEGLQALDEAGANLMSRAVDPITTGMMLCEIVCAAQSMAMHELAREWTDVMERWRHGTAFGGIHGRCRVHRAELLRISGPCDEAESEAQAACAELRPWMRREYGWPLVELGTVRLRRGDLAGAEEAFLAAHRLAWSPQPGLALLRLARGDVASAVAMIGDAIAHPPDLPWKERPPSGDLRMVPLRDAQSEIAAAAGDPTTCRTAADELVRIARDFPSRGLHAMSTTAVARAALLVPDPGRARELALVAAEEWGELGAPYEAAAARVIAGDAAAADGNLEAAQLEWAAAGRAFDDYGAVSRAGQMEDRLAGRAGSLPTSELVACFRRDGAVRVVRFGAARFAVPDLVGFRYLEHLLVRTGDEIAATDLVAAEHGDAAVGQLGLPVLDEQARASYRRRLAEVDEDIADATEMNDPERVERARRDRDFLVAELSRAVGLGGRVRQTGDNNERARTSVFRALRYAIDRLAELDPALGDHLRGSVRTGTWCRYAPDPLARVTWEN